jgi:hypothetical protein
VDPSILPSHLPARVVPIFSIPIDPTKPHAKTLPPLLSESDEDRVADETLQKLSLDPAIQGKLRSKHLRQLIQEIDQASDREAALQLASQIDLFADFSRDCLRVCGVDVLANSIL